MPKINLGRTEPGLPLKTLFVNEEEDEAAFVQSQSSSEVQAIADRVREFSNRPSFDKYTKNGQRWAGSVPIVEYYKWVSEWKAKYKPYYTLGAYVSKKFNSSDYSIFRDLDTPAHTGISQI